MQAGQPARPRHCIRRRRRADHQAGSRQNAVPMPLFDRGVDRRVEPEIVGADDQALHGELPTRAVWNSRTGEGCGRFPRPRVRAGAQRGSASARTCLNVGASVASAGHFPAAQELEEFDALAQPPAHHLRAPDHLGNERGDLLAAKVKAFVEGFERLENLGMRQMRIMNGAICTPRSSINSAWDVSSQPFSTACRCS